MNYYYYHYYLCWISLWCTETWLVFINHFFSRLPGAFFPFSYLQTELRVRRSGCPFRQPRAPSLPFTKVRESTNTFLLETHNFTIFFSTFSFSSRRFFHHSLLVSRLPRIFNLSPPLPFPTNSSSYFAVQTRSFVFPISQRIHADKWTCVHHRCHDFCLSKRPATGVEIFSKLQNVASETESAACISVARELSPEVRKLLDVWGRFEEKKNSTKFNFFFIFF